MDFEGDEAKSRRDLRERGLPFEAAVALFDRPTIEREDRRRGYGERRVLAVGEVAGRVLACVYVDRDQDGATVRRIVSLRVASRKERRAYADRA